MLKNVPTKGISTPIFVGFVLMLVILIGGFIWWQYGEMSRETGESPGIELPEEEKKVEDETAGWKDCSADDDCMVFSKDGEDNCNCGCFNKKYSDWQSEGFCFCAALPDSCECIDGQCECIDGQCEGEFLEDETADWQTYRNKKYGFEIKYPKDTRVFNSYFQDINTIASNAYIGYNPHLVFSVGINAPELYAETGIYIYANEDASQPVMMYGNKITSMCTEFSGSETAKTKIIKGETFFVVQEDMEDWAMQGRRSLYSIYDIVKNGKCYKIVSNVTWKSIEFIRTSDEGIEPTQQELEDEQKWIKSQQEINEQILSTFRFLE